MTGCEMDKAFNCGAILGFLGGAVLGSILGFAAAVLI